jgi:hypothetical protein
VARAALAALAPLDSSTISSIINNFGTSSSSSTTQHTDEPSSLDPSRPEDLLRAIRAINSVVFEDEGLADNAADPFDPLNGSIADVMDSKRGALSAGLQELLNPSHVPCPYHCAKTRIACPLELCPRHVRLNLRTSYAAVRQCPHH